MSDTTYNGWKNYQTWNVSLYINNEASLYFSAVDYVKNTGVISYPEFIEYMSLNGSVTPDGVSWTDPDLDHDELNDMLSELDA